MKKLIALAVSLLLLLPMLAMPAYAIFLMRDVGNSDTTNAVEDDGHLDFNFKSVSSSNPDPTAEEVAEQGAWVNIFNAWGSAVYMILETTPNYTRDFIVTFEVTGYDGGADGYRAMPGLALNGWGVQIWALGAEREDTTSWEEVFGEEYFYYIDGDGIYQMVFPARKAIDHFWGTTEEDEDVVVTDVQVLELGIFGPQRDTTMSVKIIDVEETRIAHTLAQAQRLLGGEMLYTPPEGGGEPAPDPTPGEGGPSEAGPPEETDPPEETTPEEPAPAEPSPAPPASNGGDDEGGNWWIWVIVALGGGGVAVVIAVVASKKKK
jgi:hypothetical protein